MDSYTTVYKKKAWSNEYFNKNHARSEPLFNRKSGPQWGYNTKKNFNYAGTKKKFNNKRHSFNNFQRKHNGSYNMSFSQPLPSKQDKKTVVEIVDSDIEMCYSETELYKNIRKKTKPENHTEDSDLFYFDISGNCYSEPTVAKHKYFGNDDKEFCTNGVSPSAFQKDGIFNNITESQETFSLSPSLLMPKISKKKRDRLSFKEELDSDKSSIDRIEDQNYNVESKVKKKKKHCKENKLSDGGEKSIKTEDCITNNNEVDVYEFIKNMMKEDFDSDKSTGSLVDVLNTSFNVQPFDENSNFKKKADKTVKRKKGSSEHDENDDKEVNRINSSNEVTPKSKKKKEVHKNGEIVPKIAFNGETVETKKSSTQDVESNKKAKKIKLSNGINNELEAFDTSNDTEVKKKKKSSGIDSNEDVLHNGADTSYRIEEFSDNSREMLEKDEEIEVTYHDFEDIEPSYVGLSDFKLSIEDVYSDEESDKTEQNDSKEEELNEKLDRPQDLTEYEKTVLAELEVVLPFDDIPILHDIQRPSKPTTAEIARGKTLNARVGPFSKQEDEQIVSNWENFLKDHELSVPPSAFFKFHRCMGIKQKIKFLQYLSHKLDDRYPFNVHCRFRRLYLDGGLKTGRFTKKEDKQIIEYINKSKSKTPYRDLGILLGRPAHSVQRRLAVLSNAKHDDKIEWNLELSQQLIEGMFLVTGLEKIEDLEHVTLSAKQWRRLSMFLDHIPEKKLERAWMLTVHPRLFLKETRDTIKRDLIKMLLVNKEKDFRTVNWKKYADNFVGVNDKKLYEWFVNMMRSRVPKEKWSNLRKVVKHLSKETCKSRKIRRYVYKDGRLELK